MKTALTLEQLAAKLTEQRSQKRDFIADTRTLTMTPDAKAMDLGGHGKMVILPFAHRQLGERLEIQPKLYDRLQGKHPDLLANLVNGLLEREPSENMVRTMNNQVRAFVSNKFRALDNFDLAEAALPTLIEQGCTVESCDITETRLYIKAVHPTLRRELELPAGLKMGEGHTIFTRLIMAAITIRNSEVGDGSLAVEDGVYERQCTNLATFIAAFRQSHVGKRQKVQELDVISEIISDTTRKLEDAVVWSKLRDRVTQAFDPANFERMCTKLVAARSDVLPTDVALPKLVEVIAQREGLNEGEKTGFLNHLLRSGESTRYGLQWAATRLAQDADSYERASELERLGGRIIELAPTEYKQILKQAA